MKIGIWWPLMGVMLWLAACEASVGSAADLAATASDDDTILAAGAVPWSSTPRDEFVLIEPGTYQVLSANGSLEERRVQTVRITKAFYLHRTEVTQGQWRAVARANPVFSPPAAISPRWRR